MTATLLDRIADGDQQAVARCIDTYGGLVWSLARRFLVNEADAEEAVQEIFMEIWENAGRYDAGVAAEVTFVSMIARRRLIDRRRKLSRDPVAEPLDEANEPFAEDLQGMLEVNA